MGPGSRSGSLSWGRPRAGPVGSLAGEDAGEPPHAEALVAPATAGLQAILVQNFNRPSPFKWCPFKIQRAPVTILAIAVGLPLRKRSRNQPRSSRSPEIRNRAFDIRIRQMHETIAAQDRVTSR